MRSLRLHQRGETIMEVMICTAVVSLIMAGAFALSNRNQAYARSAQERGIANTIAESQLEKLRNFADELKLPASDPTKVFCITAPTTGAPIADSDVKSFNVVPLDAQMDRDLTKYPAECQLATGENSASQFRFAIWPQVSAPSKINAGAAGSNRYMVTVRWESATGNGIDQIETFYEMYDNVKIDFSAKPECSDGIDNDGDGKTDYPADSLGCTSPTDPDESNPACSNMLENDAPNGGDDDGDGKKDYSPVPGAGDPQCSSPTDNDEAPDAPTVAAYNQVIDTPAVRRDCVAAEPLVRDGADGCFTDGNSIYGRRQFKVTYDTPLIKPGNGSLVITYREWGGDGPGGKVPTGYPGYKLKVTGIPGTITLPAGNPGESQTYIYPTTINFGSTPPDTMSFEWTNNVGSDPDLQIDSIRIYRNAP